MARFNATIKDEHAQNTLDVFNLVNGGRLPNAAQIVELGNLAANLMQSKANPQDFVPVGYKRQGDTFVPDTAPPGPTPGPTPTDPEATFMARAAVGQNCAWGNLLQPAEQKRRGQGGTAASLCVNGSRGRRERDGAPARRWRLRIRDLQGWQRNVATRYRRPGGVDRGCLLRQGDGAQ
jgi:hypothetical protein